jgi:sterol desaturase/sphingolipid hydroxylase (fatty acid hydroxylase superfamily)
LRKLKRMLFSAALITVLALVLFVLERYFPLRAERRALLGRLVVKFAISILTFAAAVSLVQPAVHRALRWSEEKPFGLVHLVPLPAFAQFILSFLLMDLFFYYWHLANHRVPFLWRFHNVHHIDPDLDVSTAFRFHFGEIALSAAMGVVQVSIIGISPWTFAAYQITFQAEVLFHHSNWRLPISLERMLSRIIVTPRMHGIHHSQVERENNSNFGTIFSFWDRLHRTLGLNIPQSQIVVGIPAYSQLEDNHVVNALLLPFRKQRDYWRRPDGTLVERKKEPEADRGWLAE